MPEDVKYRIRESEYDALVSQRDDLLAALTEIKKSKNWLAAWTIADQAIKKVGKEK